MPPHSRDPLLDRKFYVKYVLRSSVFTSFLSVVLLLGTSGNFKNMTPKTEFHALGAVNAREVVVARKGNSEMFSCSGAK